MIIEYIHGFCSSSKAKKAQIMKIELLKNYKDIKFVSLDFSDNFKIAMEELNEQIQSLLKEDPKVCLAASSLGGFMAMLLSIKYDLKVALVNPCLYPCKFVRDNNYVGAILKNFDTGHEFKIEESDLEYLEEQEALLPKFNLKNASVFLQAGDEVLDYTYALKFFMRGGVGGFSLKDGGSHGYDDFEEEVGKIVEFFKKD